MKILADSGSTKTSWAFIENDKVISTKNTSGFNPYYYDDEILLEIIDNELLPKLKDIAPELVLKAPKATALFPVAEG